MFKKLRKNEKGFTLAELLIVVAIIGVLVAISIPIFTSQLEKAREATDAANIRAAYAEVSTEALTDDSKNVKSLFVTATQTKDEWQMNGTGTTTMEIGGINVNCSYKGGTNTGWLIAYDSTNNKVNINATATKGSATDYPTK